MPLQDMGLRALLNEFDLSGKVAVVTGGNPGRTGVFVKALAESGADVVAVASSSIDTGKVIDEVQRLGRRGMALNTDITKSENVRNTVATILSRFEKIDILVNNAGITRDTLILRMPDTVWDEVLNTNLRGAYLCIKNVLRSMMDQGWGRIINIASLAGLVGNAGQTNYSAAKGGLIAFTKSVAREVGPRNITVNAISPGFIVTEMTDKLPQEAKDAILARIPLGRFGVADDVAGLVAFLASEQADYITAQVISVDGGVI